MRRTRRDSLAKVLPPRREDAPAAGHWTEVLFCSLLLDRRRRRADKRTTSWKSSANGMTAGREYLPFYTAWHRPSVRTRRHGSKWAVGDFGRGGKSANVFVRAKHARRQMVFVQRVYGVHACVKTTSQVSIHPVVKVKPRQRS